jgi:hypothetical protein
MRVVIEGVHVSVVGKCEETHLGHESGIKSEAISKN